MHPDATIAVCWDSDRLNLWRIGVRPDPALLSTAPARRPEIIAAARTLHAAERGWASLAAGYARLWAEPPAVLFHFTWPSAECLGGILRDRQIRTTQLTDLETVHAEPGAEAEIRRRLDPTGHAAGWAPVLSDAGGYFYDRGPPVVWLTAWPGCGPNLRAMYGDARFAVVLPKHEVRWWADWAQEQEIDPARLELLRSLPAWETRKHSFVIERAVAASEIIALDDGDR